MSQCDTIGMRDGPTNILIQLLSHPWNSFPLHDATDHSIIDNYREIHISLLIDKFASYDILYYDLADKAR